MARDFLSDIFVDGDATADSFITSGGFSTQFVKGDGSLDSSTYITGITGETLSDLSDIPAEPTGGASTYYLRYNDTGDTFSWELTSSLGGASSLDDLSDVTLTSLGDGEVLLSSGGTFINRTFAEAGIGTMTDFTLQADSGSSNVMVDGDTIDIGGGTGITTTIETLGSSSQITVDIDYTGMTDLTSGLASTDELIVNDAGTVKKMDISVLYQFLKDNITFTKTIVVENPTASDDWLFLYTDEAITITRVSTAVVGLSPSVEFNIDYASTRTGTTTSVFGSDQDADVTSGEQFTSFSNPNIPAARWVWLDIATVSGTTKFEITIEYVKQ